MVTNKIEIDTTHDESKFRTLLESYDIRSAYSDNRSNNAFALYQFYYSRYIAGKLPIGVKISDNEKENIDSIEIFFEKIISILNYELFRKCKDTYEMYRIEHVFMDKYLIPTLNSLYNKIKNYKIDFYDENPFKDAFDIAFISFYNNELGVMKTLIKKNRKRLSRFEKRINVKATFVNSTDNPKPYNINYTLSDLDMWNKLDGIDSKELFSICVLNTVYNILSARYLKYIKDGEDEIFNKISVEINNFHIGNSLTLTDYSSLITNKIMKILSKYNFNMHYEFFDDDIILGDKLDICNPDFIREKCSEFGVQFDSLLNIINGISHPSKHDSLDTFIPEEELTPYINDVYNVYKKILENVSKFKSEFVKEGYRDIKLNAIVGSIMHDLCKNRFTKIEIKHTPPELVVETKASTEITFSVEKVTGILDNYFRNKSDIYSTYGEDYEVMLSKVSNYVTETANLINKEFNNSFLHCLGRILGYNSEKLYDNSMKEMAYDIADDIRIYLYDNTCNMLYRLLGNNNLYNFFNQDNSLIKAR